MTPTQIEALSHDLAYKILAPPEIAAIIAKHAGGSGVMVGGRPAKVAQLGEACLGRWAIFDNRGNIFRSDVTWGNAFPRSVHLHPTREAAEAFLSQHADQPTK